MASSFTHAETVDLLLHNGTVLLLDADQTTAQAMAIKGDRIIATGGAELLSEYSSEQTIDLGGRTEPGDDAVGNRAHTVLDQLHGLASEDADGAAQARRVRDHVISVAGMHLCYR